MKRFVFLVLIAFGLGLPRTGYGEVTEENKKILKDALVGAITGVAAVEGTNDDVGSAAATEAVTGDPGAARDKDKKHRHHKKNFSERKRHHRRDHDDDEDGDEGKDKKRPHGWDMGRKVGWGGKKVPPGQAKKAS